MRVVCALALAAAAAAAVASAAGGNAYMRGGAMTYGHGHGHGHAQMAHRGDVLYVWAGRDGRSFTQNEQEGGNDFLAVVDFEKSSPTYGKILSTVELADGMGMLNEPRGLAITADGRYLVAGAALGVATSRPDLYVFDIATNPAQPNLTRTIDVPDLGCPQEIRADGAHGVIVSMMCDGRADSPGGVVRVDLRTDEVTEAIKGAPLMTSPAASSSSSHRDALLVADFAVPISITTAKGEEGEGAVFRDTVQAYSLSGGGHKGAWRMPNAGGIGDVKFVPHDKFGRAYAAGSRFLYVLEEGREPLAVFDMASVGEAGPRHSMSSLVFSRDGRTLLVSYAGRFVMMFDVREPDFPRLQDSYDFGGFAGTSLLQLTSDDRLVVTNYLVDYDDLGEAQGEEAQGENMMWGHYAGARSINVFQADQGSLALDHRFAPDFAKLSARPSGTAARLARDGSSSSYTSSSSSDDDDDDSSSNLYGYHYGGHGDDQLVMRHECHGRLESDHHKVWKMKVHLAHLQGKAMLGHVIKAGRCVSHHSDVDEHELENQQAYIDWAYAKGYQPYAYGEVSSALYSTTERRRTDVWDDDDAHDGYYSSGSYHRVGPDPQLSDKFAREEAAREEAEKAEEEDGMMP